MNSKNSYEDLEVMVNGAYTLIKINRTLYSEVKEFFLIVGVKFAAKIATKIVEKHVVILPGNSFLFLDF